MPLLLAFFAHLLRPLFFNQKESRWGFKILHGLLSDTNIRITMKNKFWGPPLPPPPPKKNFKFNLEGHIIRVMKFLYGLPITKILGFQERKKLGGRVEGLACADPGARTPIGASGNLYPCRLIYFYVIANFWSERCCAGSPLLTAFFLSLLPLLFPKKVLTLLKLCMGY